MAMNALFDNEAEDWKFAPAAGSTGIPGSTPFAF